MANKRESNASNYGFQTGENEEEGRKNFKDWTLPGSNIQIKDLKNLAKDAFDVDIKSWLKTVLPLAEFLLFLVAIMVFIQIGPADMAANCAPSLQESCLERYILANGTYDSALTDLSCGASRVNCWRSGLKGMLYRGQDVPDDTKDLDLDNIGLPAVVLDEWRPGLTYCLCMLTQNGQSALPVSPSSWRDQTDYFCDVLENINQGIGISGLVLACFMVATKAMIEAEEYNVKRAIPPVTLIIGGWVAWSIAVVIITAEYSFPGPTTNCGLPAANIFYYVFIIGIMSLIGALYALYVVMRVVYKIYTGKLDE